MRRNIAIVAAGLVTLAALHAEPANAAFPDAFNTPPPGWNGPVFKLSQNYPATLPRLEPLARRKWRQFDPRNPAEGRQYLQAVLDYCLEGNIENDFASIGENPVRKWYHAPWLHTTSGGREFIRGLTRERPSRVPELGPAHTRQHDNWAVGFYNARGGYTIGQVWKNESQPDPRKGTFPSNTVACKLLFTTTPLSEVPYLEGTLEWQADINRQSGTGPRPILRLLQLDVAVKDNRVNSTTGWVFGTFQDEKDASTSSNWWEHMVPVGLMWGSDVTNVLANSPPTQQWINTSRGQQLHLGFRGLLNGPIDNPQASCSGCHGFAQIPRVAGAFPSIPRVPTRNASNNTITRYFTNIKAGAPLSPDYFSLDYSLQLQMGISRAVAAGQASLPAGSGVFDGGVMEPLPTHIPTVTRD